MNETMTNPATPAEASPEDRLTMLFAQMVMQQTNMAMMLLGKVAHPETGQVVKNLDAARLFIDQLEMLEAKTKGNLDKQEQALLKQSLMSLRMAFVEEVESAPAPAEEAKREPQAQGSGATPAAQAAPSAAEDEHRKKFTKKY